MFGEATAGRGDEWSDMSSNAMAGTGGTTKGRGKGLYFKKRKNQMTPNEYQKLAERTINNELTNKGKEHHALYGMCSEIGEIQALYQKQYQGHGEPDEDHLRKEVGDLLWFVAEYCTANEWTLEDVMAENIKKLRKRYPDGFDYEKSIHRKEGDI